MQPFRLSLRARHSQGRPRICDGRALYTSPQRVARKRAALSSRQRVGRETLTMIQRRMTVAVPSMVLAITGFVMAAESDSNVLKNTGALARLVRQSGVYNTSPTGKTPNFER